MMEIINSRSSRYNKNTKKWGPVGPLNPYEKLKF